MRNGRLRPLSAIFRQQSTAGKEHRNGSLSSLAKTVRPRATSASRCDRYDRASRQTFECSAGEIAAEGATALGGGGSRDPKLAQAGGPNADGMDEAVAIARAKAQEALAAR